MLGLGVIVRTTLGFRIMGLWLGIRVQGLGLGVRGLPNVCPIYIFSK